MRKAILAGIFLFFLIWPHPHAGHGGSVVRSAYAPEGVFYAWSDALGAPGGARPKETVVCLPDGTCTTTEAGRWASDADCEAWSPGLTEKLDNLLGELVGAGFDPVLLRGLKVYLLPAYALTLLGEPDKPGYGVFGFQVPGTGIIVLAGLWWDTQRNFLHELGHLVANKTLGVLGYGWQGANEKGREYLKIRNYPDKPLGEHAQAELPWDGRAAEWFAEDFAFWAGLRMGHYGELGFEESDYAALPGPLDEKVLEWFDKEFLKKKNKKEV